VEAEAPAAVVEVEAVPSPKRKTILKKSVIIPLKTN
jgi:hypothetical protein